MPVRRLLWIGISLLLVVLIGSLGGLAWLLLHAQGAPIRLVVVGPNTKLRLIGGDGERVLASDASGAVGVDFAFPAPSPDGRQLAYIAMDERGAAILRLDLATGERKELYRSGVNYPFDLAWSPDGKSLVFLAGSQLRAQVVPADGSSPSKV